LFRKKTDEDNNENPINSAPLESKTEGVPMDKKEFQASLSPEALAFFKANHADGLSSPDGGGDTTETDATNVAGETAAPVASQTEITAKARAKSVIASDSYPSNIRAQASDFLAGDSNETVFMAALGAHDAVMEAMNSANAQAETGVQGETAPAADSKGDESTLVNNLDDIKNLAKVI
jgi:uncharacterized protein (DUF885 family)